jgi:hypothetical protein
MERGGLMYSGQDLYNASKEQRKELINAVNDMKSSGRYLATAERDFKIALRKEILRLHIEDNVAWTACENLAKGDENVAILRFKRDVHRSDYEVALERINAIKLEIRLLENEIAEEKRGA